MSFLITDFNHSVEYICILDAITSSGSVVRDSNCVHSHCLDSRCRCWYQTLGSAFGWRCPVERLSKWKCVRPPVEGFIHNQSPLSGTTFASAVISFISVGWWSAFGDRRGRKPVLFISLLGSVILCVVSSSPGVLLILVWQ
jgi:hypothetical protein